MNGMFYVVPNSNLKNGHIVLIEENPISCFYLLIET